MGVAAMASADGDDAVMDADVPPDGAADHQGAVHARGEEGADAADLGSENPAGTRFPDAGAEMDAEADAGAGEPDERVARRRGRRPAGEDTRAALLAAAGGKSAERGYDKATVRVIAERAGVDPAMVNHWFGGKDALFVAALDIPVDPEVIFTQVSGDPEQLGSRLVRTSLRV